MTETLAPGPRALRAGQMVRIEGGHPARVVSTDPERGEATVFVLGSGEVVTLPLVVLRSEVEIR